MKQNVASLFIILFLLNSSCIAAQFEFADTIFFKGKTTTLSKKNIQTLYNTANKIKTNNVYSISIISYGEGKRSLRSFLRMNNIDNFLIDSCRIDKYQLRGQYAKKGKANMVIIRPSTEEESSGTNCRPPPFPKNLKPSGVKRAWFKTHK